MAPPRTLLCAALAGVALSLAACTSEPPASAAAARDAIELEQAKLLVEHNATARDTGFQGFVDGEPWSRLTVRDADGTPVLDIKSFGELRDTGLTELFFETDEPPNDEVPIDDMLARLPAGTYAFEATLADGGAEIGRATLSHEIPAGPVIVSPIDGAEVATDEDLAFRWRPVTTSIRGEPLTVTHYEVILEVADQPSGPGFGAEIFDVHVPATTTALRVPREFLRPGTSYQYEVLAIAANGNQTLSSGVLSTRPAAGA